MLKYILLIVFIFLSENFSQHLYQNEPIVRVRIINTLDTLKLTFNDKWKITSKESAGQFLQSDSEIIFTTESDGIKILDENTIMFSDFILYPLSDSSTVIIKDVPFGVGWWWEGKEDRIYEGEIHFFVTEENKFEVVVHLPLEQYLKGVVPYEIGGNSPLEALKAQTVAARSEAIIALTSKLYSGKHYDLTSDVECQVFSGNKNRTPQSDLAVEQTESLVLSENGKPINAYYASNCGGHSELIRNVWPDRPVPESYQVSNFDWDDSILIDLTTEEDARKWIFSNPPAFCNPNIHNDLPQWSKNNFRWEREFTTQEIRKMLSKGNDFGNLLDIKIMQRGTSGRAYLAKFIFEKDSIEVTGELKIRQMFTPPLRSSCFVIDKTETGFVLHGAGWGHGVGMCQSGAITMSNAGKSCEEILRHYYRKAKLLNIY